MGSVTLTLSWEEAPNATSYTLLYGRESGKYTERLEGIKPGKDFSPELDPMAKEGRWYFAMTATGPDGESAPSNEITKVLKVVDKVPPKVQAPPKFNRIDFEWVHPTKTLVVTD